jgi:hypothetical protein
MAFTYIDYAISHNLNNYRDDNGAHYDYVNSDIWIREQSLCDIINKEFNLDIIPLVRKIISKELSENIWHYLSDNGINGITGIYGDNFLNEWKY